MIGLMCERRKREITIKFIIMMAILLIFGIWGFLGKHAVIADIGIIFGVFLITLGELIIGMCVLPYEFNYAIGMGKTRKEFYKSNIIITFISVCVLYLVLFVVTNAYALLNLKIEALEYVCNPLFAILVLSISMFGQVFGLWLAMEYPQILWLTGVGVSIVINSMLNNNLLRIVNALVHGTSFEKYNEIVAYIFILFMLVIGFVVISKKVLKLRVNS